MTLTEITLLALNGPHGALEPREPHGDDQPVTHGYRWIDDPDHGMFMSVWDSTPCILQMRPFPNHELFLVTDGSVTIVEPDGHERTFRAGECFIFPQGAVRQWKQTEYFRKYAVGFKDNSWQEPADPAMLRYIPLDPNGPLEESEGPPAELLLGPPPTRHSRRWFEDPTGQFVVSEWDTTACHYRAKTAEANEWFHILAGSVTLTDAAGVAHPFKQRDTFIVPVRTSYSWKCEGYVRAIHCALLPRPSTAQAL